MMTCISSIFAVVMPQGVSTLDLGQDTVMEAADQEVVQPSRPSDLKPCSTVGLPDSMPSPIYEVHQTTSSEVA